MNDLTDLSELLYKLNKYQTLLKTDENVNNKDLYQKKILSYTNKINNIQQTGGLTADEIKRLTPEQINEICLKRRPNVQEIDKLIGEVTLDIQKITPFNTSIDKAIEARIKEYDEIFRLLTVRIKDLEKKLSDANRLAPGTASADGAAQDAAASAAQLRAEQGKVAALQTELDTERAKHPSKGVKDSGTGTETTDKEKTNLRYIIDIRILNKKIKKLEAELKAATEAAAKGTDNAAEVARLNVRIAELEAQLKELQTKLKAALAARDAADKAASATGTEHTATVARLQAELLAAQQTSGQHAKELERLRKEHARRIAEHATAIAQLRPKSDCDAAIVAAVKEAEARHVAALEAERAKHAAALQAAESRHATALAAERARYTALEESFAAERARHATALAAAQQATQQATQQAAQQAAEHRAALEAATSENARLSGQVTNKAATTIQVAALRTNNQKKDKLITDLRQILTDLMEFYTEVKKSIYYNNMKEIDELLKIIYDTLPGGTLYDGNTILPRDLIDKLGLSEMTIDPQHRHQNANIVFKNLKSVCKSPSRNVTQPPIIKERQGKDTILLTRLNTQILEIDRKIRELNLQNLDKLRGSTSA